MHSQRLGMTLTIHRSGLDPRSPRLTPRAPTPTAAPRRRGRPRDPLTRGERIDRVMRDAYLAVIQGLPRRPSESWDDLARGRHHPWRVEERRLREAACAGARKDRATTALLSAVAAMVDLIWEEEQPAAAVAARIPRAGARGGRLPAAA